MRAVDLSIPLSDILINVKFGGDKERMLRQLESVVSVAKSQGLYVCIGGEDASRASIAFIEEVMCLGKALGADRFRYCDTVGILTTSRTFETIRHLVSLDLLSIEMHTHNDYGLANANALSGLDAGAISVNTTVIGLGERAGNASFEQISMALKHLYGKSRVIDATAMRNLTHIVAKAAGIVLSPNAPIVGERLFAHESGIHADGMMKQSNAYEPFDASEVGATREFPIGKHYGASTMLYHLKNFGISDYEHIYLHTTPAMVPFFESFGFEVQMEVGRFVNVGKVPPFNFTNAHAKELDSGNFDAIIKTIDRDTFGENRMDFLLDEMERHSSLKFALPNGFKHSSVVNARQVYL